MAEEDDDKGTPNPTPDPPTPDPTPAPAQHVTREEFDGLKGAIDGLTQRIAELAPVDPTKDESPGGKPWTHWGGHRG